MTHILEPISRNNTDRIKGWADNEPDGEQTLTPRLARGRTSPARLPAGSPVLSLLAASRFHSFLTLPVSTPSLSVNHLSEVGQGHPEEEGNSQVFYKPF